MKLAVINLSVSKEKFSGFEEDISSPLQLSNNHPSLASALNEIDVPLSATLSLGVDITEPASGGSTVVETSKVGVLLVLQPNNTIRLTVKN